MAWLDDLATRAETEAVATRGTTLFFTLHSAVPAQGTGPFLLLVEIPGRPPKFTHDTVDDGAAYQVPRAQVVGIAPKYADAAAIARKAYKAFTVTNKVINGVRYLKVRPLQEPFDMGLDAAGRPRVGFNIEGEKTPSFA